MNTIYLLIILLYIPVIYGAQNSLRPATESEVAGLWEDLKLPGNLQLKGYPSDPWPAQCQWFFYDRSGTFKRLENSDHSDRALEKCPVTMTAAKLTNAMKDVKALGEWKFQRHSSGKSSAIALNWSDAPDHHEIWQTRYVTREFSEGGHRFKPGDILFLEIDPNTNQPRWFRHLRRVR